MKASPITHRALTTLHLGGNSIGAEGERALAEALKTNRALTTLHLGGNSIGDEAQAAVAAVLEREAKEEL